MRGYLWLVSRTTSGAVPVHPAARYLTLLSRHRRSLAVSLFFMAADPRQLHPARGREPHLAVGRTSARLDAGRHGHRDAAGRGGNLRTSTGSTTSSCSAAPRPRATGTCAAPRSPCMLDKLDHSLLLKLSSLAGASRSSAPMMPAVENKGRAVPQNAIEAEIFERVRPVPDIRAIKLNDRGERRHQLLDPVGERGRPEHRRAARLESALRGDPLLAERRDRRRPAPARNADHAPRRTRPRGWASRTAAIAADVRVATIGDFDAALAKLSIDNRLIPIRVQLDDAARERPRAHLALKVPTAPGATVPLVRRGRRRLGEGPSIVKRLNRERNGDHRRQPARRRGAWHRHRPVQGNRRRRDLPADGARVANRAMPRSRRNLSPASATRCCWASCWC